MGVHNANKVVLQSALKVADAYDAKLYKWKVKLRN